MEAIGLKDRSNFLENYLNAAIGLELVEAVYPDLTKHSPKQKYRLTEQGKAVLKKHGITPDLPIIIDYGGDLVSVYDPVSVMPYNEPPITERTRYKKLNAEQKAAFKSMIVSAVTAYWKENRLIPFGEDMADIRKWTLEAFAEEYGILMKEDSELKSYLSWLKRHFICARILLKLACVMPK